MKQGLKYPRILILLLLSISVLTPIVFFSFRSSDINSSFANREFADDSSNFKYTTEDSFQLNSIRQETGEGLKGPAHVVYKDDKIESVVLSSDDTKLLHTSGSNGDSRSSSNGDKWSGSSGNRQYTTAPKVQVNHTVARQGTGHSQPRRIIDEKVREMKDHVIRAKAYLTFAPPNSNSHLVKDLRLRIKEIERAVGEATKDSDLSKSALQKKKSMEAVLAKADRMYGDCFSMAKRLRAMTYNAEEQMRAQKNEASFLVQLAARTTPKGLHCLYMQLTSDYFAIQSEKRVLPNQQRLQNTEFYHYAVFSDNILACAVVVNSTISASREPEKVIIHVVTDSLNLPAMTMWFLLNPPKKAAIEIKSIDDFEGLSSKDGVTIKVQDSLDPRFTSPLNYLRFYLPEIFPALDKIVLLDHDVVVQRDLKELWRIDMKGKVNAAVDTCQIRHPTFRRMDMLINFSDPYIVRKFDIKACTWAFGVNVFNLREWRRQNLTALYHDYLKLGQKKQLWKAGSLPLGLVTFYNRTVFLDRRWHVLGLGYDSGVGRAEIDRAAVIHYDGPLKPWLDIGIGRYMGYWKKHVKYNHPYLLQCNIHE